jgi:hypothetical protein
MGVPQFALSADAFREASPEKGLGRRDHIRRIATAGLEPVSTSPYQPTRRLRSGAK